MALAQSQSTPEDTPVPVVLSALDVEGDGLTFTNLTQPAHGALSGTPPNLLYTATPSAQFVGYGIQRLVNYLCHSDWADTSNSGAKVG